MKIILSRKNFDSSYGGHPNFILPDGRMVPLPIPSENDSFSYGELYLDENHTFSDYMSKLFKKIKEPNSTKNYTSIAETKCHLDPDIIPDMIPSRTPEWRGAFGQKGAAQTVLENNNVGEGDLFLFFGWFNHLTEENGSIKYKRGSGFHALYGYLEVGEVIYPRSSFPEWLKYHPHTMEERKDLKSNCIYIARERASWNSALPGYGTFFYDDSLKLTKSGYSRSRWELPDFFKNLKITYHKPSSWKDEYFQSACIGQEFIVEENEKVSDWAKNLIEMNKIWNR